MAQDKTTREDKISERRSTCFELYHNNKEGRWKKKEFYEAYNQKLMEDGTIDKKLSDNTIYRDCKKMEISFNKSSLNRNRPHLYPDFGKTIGKYISQIRCTCRLYDIIILNGTKEADLITKDEIESRLSQIIKASKSQKNKEPKVKSHTMIHLHFIFSVRGFEHRFAEILDMQKMNERDFLYISSHNYCTEVVFEFQYLDSYIERIYEICSSIKTK